MTNTPDYWLIDIEVRGQWQPAGSSAYELTREKAQNRADVVHYWRPVRVIQVTTRETWQRDPGKGWRQVEASAAPRRPLRAAVHAVPSASTPEGIPDSELPYWIR